MSNFNAEGASGAGNGLKKLKIAEDGSTFIEEERPLIIRTYHISTASSPKKELKYLGRKTKLNGNELKKGSIISSKQYILPQRLRNEVGSTFQEVTQVPEYDGDPQCCAKILLGTADQISGFVEALDGKRQLTIKAPIETSQQPEFSFMWQRGILLISNITRLTVQDIEASPPTVNVWTYKGFEKKKETKKNDVKTLNATVDVPEEDKISSQLYVFCGNGPKITYLKDCFIRFEDLRDRVNGDSAMLDAHGGFPVWSANGKQVEKTDFMEKYGKWNKSDRFRGMSRLLQGAQTRPWAPYNVVARFWDAKVELKETITFYMVFHTDVFKALVEKFPSNPSPEAKIRETIKSTLDSSKLSYKPHPNHFEIAFVDDFKKHANKAWFQIGRHPNDIYRMYMSRKDFRRLIEASKGLYRPPLEYEFDTIIEMKKAFSTQVAKIKTLFVKREANQDAVVSEGQAPTTTKKEGRGTITYVTKTRVETAAGKKRHIDQNTVMGGNSANDLMNALFKRDKNDSDRRAEWLHRSARAYGGLDWEPLETTQTPENLILGTVETNTMMLRQELFIKRYVCNAKLLANATEEVQMVVRTRLLHAFGKKDNFNSKVRSLWFGGFLWYEYRVRNQNAMPLCNQTVIFYPFARRNPMRLELFLDIALEKLIYGWGDVDVPERKDDYDSGDDDGADAMRDEGADVMTDETKMPSDFTADFQINIEVEDIWEDNDPKDATLPFDQAEVLIAAEAVEDLQ